VLQFLSLKELARTRATCTRFKNILDRSTHANMFHYTYNGEFVGLALVPLWIRPLITTIASRHSGIMHEHDAIWGVNLEQTPLATFTRIESAHLHIHGSKTFKYAHIVDCFRAWGSRLNDLTVFTHGETVECHQNSIQQMINSVAFLQKIQRIEMLSQWTTNMQVLCDIDLSPLVHVAHSLHTFLFYFRDNYSITPSQQQALSQCTQLTDFGSGKLSTVIDWLAALPSLTRLRMCNTFISSNLFSQLTRYPRLITLWPYGWSRVPDNQWHQLTCFTNLERLRLHIIDPRSNHLDVIVPHLIKLQKLKLLMIGGNELVCSNEQLLQIVRHLPQLTELMLSEVTVIEVHAFNQSKLEQLHFLDCTGLTATAICSSLPAMPTLKILNIHHKHATQHDFYACDTDTKRAMYQSLRERMPLLEDWTV